mmetsp:Transcript_1124/g.1529  ORF Transcript_1124/g.1529 Transcript_1124/m.1529 type:complete len:105 (-) Transcript_1124:1086-1400(-)
MSPTRKRRKVTPSKSLTITATITVTITNCTYYYTSYFHQSKSEAYSLFLGRKKKKENEDTVVRVEVTKQILLLRNAWLTCHSWRKLVNDDDTHNVVTENDIFKI